MKAINMNKIDLLLKEKDATMDNLIDHLSSCYDYDYVVKSLNLEYVSKPMLDVIAKYFNVKSEELLKG